MFQTWLFSIKVKYWSSLPRSYLTELNRINRRRIERARKQLQRGECLMAPESFAAIKKQNRLEGLLTPWSLKILTSKKPQNSFQAKHFNCHKYFQPQPSLVHVHIILIDKQIPGPNKTECAQLVRYRYALYGTGTLPNKKHTDMCPLYENKTPACLTS